ncbi:hypothetical protein Smp_081600 [Schistosoma mansoni]|uniref:hypothetical protein n=1 Tax=Schistosoma mansoni TaxID=6183 RepID=UPI00022DC4FA|nr:hypothetical protein Smp_081600 [Schistosoma mansoni]|eukprot:XP_018653808.1 hypothetical protein Smp_081600 [Schistosoma mansoni]
MAVVEKSTMSKEFHVHQGGFPFLDIEVIPNFIDENEEAMLVEEIDKQTWVLSQSGRRKQVCLVYLKCLPFYHRNLVHYISLIFSVTYTCTSSVLSQLNICVKMRLREGGTLVVIT